LKNQKYTEKQIKMSKEDDYDTDLNLDKMLQKSVEKRDDDNTRFLVNTINEIQKRFIDNGIIKNDSSYTYAHSLCENKSDLEDLKYLLSFKPNINFDNVEDKNILISAMINDNEEALDMILNNNKSVNLNDVLIYGKPLVFYMAKHFDLHLFKKYTEKLDLDMSQLYFDEDEEGSFDIFHSIVYQNAKIESPLYFSIGNLKNKEEYKKDFFLKLDYILDNTNIDINEVDSQGWTILHFASLYENKDILGYLIERGADLNIRTLEDKELPEDIALANNNHDIRKFLQEKRTIQDENEEIYKETHKGNSEITRLKI